MNTIHSRPYGEWPKSIDPSTAVRLTPLWIAGAALVAYWPSLSLGWWRDDWSWLFGPLRFPALFWDFANADTMGEYRPFVKCLASAFGAMGLAARVPSRLFCVLLLVAGALGLAALIRELTGDPLGATLAALVYVSNGRIAIQATAVNMWGPQLYALAGSACLLYTIRFSREGSTLHGAASLACFVLALGCFEGSLNLPFAMAAILWANGRRALRSYWPVLAAAGIAATFGVLHLLDPDVSTSHRPAPLAVWRNLLFFLGHDQGILWPMAASLLILALRRRAALPLFISLMLIGLFPGLLYPRLPDTMLFGLVYLGAAGAVGAALSEMARVLRLRNFPTGAAIAGTAALAGLAGLIGHSAVVGLISHEWEMKNSRALPEALARTGCLGHRPAWIVPLGLDPADRKIAFASPAEAPTPLTGLCGAPVVLELDTASVAGPPCRPNTYFLDRENDLFGCEDLSDDRRRVAVAMACGAREGHAGLLRPAGSWMGTPITCVNVPRGHGIDPERPKVVAEGDRLTVRKTASVTFDVPAVAKSFEARAEVACQRRHLALDSRRAAIELTIYQDERRVDVLRLATEEGPAELRSSLAGEAATLTLAIQIPADAVCEVQLDSVRFRSDG